MMNYIIKNSLLEEYLKDDDFKKALLEEVRIYIDDYFPNENLQVYGEWQGGVWKNNLKEHQKIDDWVKLLLRRF